MSYLILGILLLILILLSSFNVISEAFETKKQSPLKYLGTKKIEGVPAIDEIMKMESLVLWLSANNSENVTKGKKNAVLEWKDRSNRSNLNFKQRGIIPVPKLNKGSLGKMPYITFDGKSGLFTKGGPLKQGTDQFSYAVVWRPKKIMEATIYGQGSDTRGQGTSASFVQEKYGYGFTARWVDARRFPYKEDEWHVSVLRVDDQNVPNVQIYSNGKIFSETTNSAGRMNIGNDHTSIGMNIVNKRPFVGDIAEILVFDAKLSNEESKKVVAFLENKYGTPTKAIKKSAKKSAKKGDKKEESKSDSEQNKPADQSESQTLKALREKVMDMQREVAALKLQSLQ